MRRSDCAGSGFSPILTGRENVYVNMSILGLSRKEIDERFDEVVALRKSEMHWTLRSKLIARAWLRDLDSPVPCTQTLTSC